MAKTPNQTPAAPALSPARAQLQQTLEANQRAIALADKAAKVVQSAGEAVEQARAESVKHDRQADDAVQSRLAMLKGERPAKSAEEIRAAQRNRIIAKEELLAADQTLEAAKQELEAMRGSVDRTAKVMASHATSVLGESTRDVISLWEKISLERERLRVILGSLIMTPGVALDALPEQQRENTVKAAVSQAGLPFGDYRDWVHLQNKVGAALHRNFAQQDPGPGIARAQAYWASFADALLADPAAELPALPTADSLFGQ